MLLWIVIALLTAAAILAVLLPLGRRPAAAPDESEKARRVYLNQLADLERDRAQGRIEPAEAEAARAEIARRLLGNEAGGTATQAGVGQGSQSARRATALLALIGIPLISIGTYVALGAPGLPGQPLANRLAAASPDDDVLALVTKVEAHLVKNPQDGKGWDVIAPVYRRLGRSTEAETAYRNAIRILGSEPARQVGLGEAILMGTGGVVTAEAKAAFSAANDLDPSAPAPRFFLALAAEQEGDKTKATQDLRALLAEAPIGAPWRAAVEAALGRLAPGQAPGGPAPEQVAAAQAMAPAEQTAMIEGMVAGLADRLASQPDNVEGWLRLIRSYMVLGRPADALKATQDALRGVRNGEERGQVEALAADLGLAQGGILP